MKLQTQDGKVLLQQGLPSHYGGFPNVYCNRGYTQKAIFEYALSLGIEFRFGSRVSDYFEGPDSAGIKIGDETFIADAVVVADGVHSKGRALITGIADKPQSSGFAVYRSWFPMDAIKGDPLLQDIVNSKDDLFLVWIGPDTHAIVLTNVKEQHVVCFCTHKVRIL